MLARYNRRMKKIPTDSFADSGQYQSVYAVVNQETETGSTEDETETVTKIKQEDFETYLLKVIKKNRGVPYEHEEKSKSVH